MCGVTGILRLGATPGNPWSTLLDRMTDSLAHRGPDDRGVWTDGRVGLGSRRLAVIDLSPAGHMPMVNESGTVVIAYNGEVYNFRELREKHGLDRRHTFRSRTDTEVILRLYEDFGLRMVEELNGMFAVAIWDARSSELHLIRDRYGIKPLFYQQDGEHFRFGSEIKAILADERVPRTPDLQALHDYLTFDYVPGAQTAFEGIREVPPAHTMSVTVEGVHRFRRYWDLEFAEDAALDEEAAAARALELMDRAVERRLIADVPIGVLLSGGLDSSAIVALMSRHASEPIHTYSVGFEEASFNELPYARVVSERYGTVHREVVVTPRLVREQLTRQIGFIDEPYADGSAIPTYAVCGLAKDEVVVVLSGEGGDEAFAGYETYAAAQASRWFRPVPRWFSRGVLLPLVGHLPASDKKLPLRFKLKRFLGGQGLPPPVAHLWWRIVLTEAQKSVLYTDDVKERLVALPSDRHFREVFARKTFPDVLSGLLYLDANVFMPDDLMIKNDRMSMAHSLEARVPFTDPELTQFLGTVPSRLKLKGLRKKHLMRVALRGILPRQILDKKKVGLEMPYSRWFRSELKDLVDTYLGRERVEASGLFRPEAVDALVAEHQSGRVDNGRALWGLLNYMVWFDAYIR